MNDHYWALCRALLVATRAEPIRFLIRLLGQGVAMRPIGSFAEFLGAVPLDTTPEDDYGCAELLGYIFNRGSVSATAVDPRRGYSLHQDALECARHLVGQLRDIPEARLTCAVTDVPITGIEVWVRARAGSVQGARVYARPLASGTGLDVATAIEEAVGSLRAALERG